MSKKLFVEDAVDQGKRARIDKGSVRLTERDLQSLLWIGEQYAIRNDQLARLLGRAVGRTLSESTMRAAVSRWVRAGLAKSRKVTVKEPGFVWLTTRGLREVGLSFKAWEPSASTVTHLFWTNQVRLYVEDRHPDFVWRAERYMRSGRPMQTISDAATHIADGELRSETAVVGVEVELTSKSAPRREAIMKLLANEYATVWYFAPQGVLVPLERTASQLDQRIRDRLRIYPLERVA